MATKLRAYGYPVLSPYTDDYSPSEEFSARISAQPLPEVDQVVEIEYSLTCKSTFVNEMLLAGNAAIILDVSAPGSLYRNVFTVDGFDGTVQLEAGVALGSVAISPQVLAVRELVNTRFEKVHPEFGANPMFTVPAGGLLAYGETVTIPLRFKPMSFEGLFVVNTRPDFDPNEYKIVAEGNVISILMGVNARSVHEFQRAHADYKDYLNTSVYKDACVHALARLFSADDIEDFVWAQAFREKLGTLNINEPEQLDFDTLNPIALRLLSSFAYEKIAKDIQNV